MQSVAGNVCECGHAWNDHQVGKEHCMLCPCSKYIYAYTHTEAMLDRSEAQGTNAPTEVEEEAVVRARAAITQHLTGMSQEQVTKASNSWCQCGHTQLAHHEAKARCTLRSCACPLFVEAANEERSYSIETPDELGQFQTGRLMQDVRYMMLHMGLDPKSPGLLETPRRVAELYREFCRPADLAAILKQGFENPPGALRDMIVQGNIPFRGLCEHHFLPFFGRAYLGYIPQKRIVGLSKITRLVQAAGTMRPSTQEAITNQIAGVFHTVLDPLGTMVVTSALHTCMSVRGVNSPDVYTKVSACRGTFLHVQAAREEFLALMHGG